MSPVDPSISHDESRESSEKIGMKLLLVGDYPPPYGGISIHVQELSREMKKKGIPHEVLNIGENRKQESQDYVSVKSPADFLVKLMVYGRGATHLHVHTNGHNNKSWLLIFSCGLAAFVLRLTPVLTIHSGISPHYMTENASPIRRTIIGFSLAFYKKIICVNQEILRVCTNRSKGNRKLVLIPAFVGIDPERETDVSEGVRDFIRDHAPTICSIVHFSREYGTELLVEAVRKIRNRFPKIGLILIAGGKRPMSYLNLESESGLGNSFLVLSEVPHERCIGIVAATDLFVRPSFADGDSVSVREALSVGKPVVASDAVSRPCGTVLFKTGNMEDLVERIVHTLRNNGLSRDSSHKTETDGFKEKILNLYKDL
jgi:glycosyltransferase involved in cell wall biosynthesis